MSVPAKLNKGISPLFVRSLLEQSATVWHSSLTQGNSEDLERVHKSAFKIMLGEKYESYSKSLIRLDMQNLHDRREQLCMNFAIKCLKNPKTAKIFPLNNKSHNMGTRNPEKFNVQHAINGRLKKSPVIYMQTLLNDHESKQMLGKK